MERICGRRGKDVIIVVGVKSDNRRACCLTGSEGLSWNSFDTCQGFASFVVDEVHVTVFCKSLTVTIMH